MSESLRASRGTKEDGAQIDRTEQDIPGKWVIVSIFVAMIPIAGLLWWFMRGTQIEHNTAVLIAISVLFILLAGLLVAAVCGYMAGLIGSSNSPVSGVGLLVVVITAVVILSLIHIYSTISRPSRRSRPRRSTTSRQTPSKPPRRRWASSSTTPR